MPNAKRLKVDCKSKTVIPVKPADTNTSRVEVDISLTVRKKGPPAKGLEMLNQNKRNKRTTSVDLDDSSDKDNDDEYFPDDTASYISDESNTSDIRTSSSDVSSESECDDNAEVKCMNQEQDGDWFEVKGVQQMFNFDSNQEIQNAVPDVCQGPEKFFELFVDDEVIEIMVRETNRNAQQVIAKSVLKVDSRIRSWRETDKDEMRRFLGLICWMGLVRMPSIDSYWKKSSIFKNFVAPVIMTRNRFQLLLRMWHFSNNEEQIENDRLFKVRDFVALILSKFTAAKIPGADIVIDESMISFRGRLRFRQYMPAKAHKYGIKLFKLCDPQGYTYNIKIYAGKQGEIVDSLATDVVMNLSDLYLDAGRTLCTDNFYTSLPLAEKLLSRKTHLVGTLRANRKHIPKSVTATRLQRGEVVARENSKGIVVLKWRDKRDVLLLSTKHTDTNKRNNSVVVKPASVVYYNNCKQGIDLADQMSSYYSSGGTINIVLGTAVVNSLQLYNEKLQSEGKKIMNMVSFRERIAMSLLQCVRQADPHSAADREEEI
jgi:hypothetical protein